MLPPGLEIVGIARVEFTGDRVALELQLSDGSTCACWWSVETLRECMGVVTAPTHAPVGAALN